MSARKPPPPQAEPARDLGAAALVPLPRHLRTALQGARTALQRAQAAGAGRPRLDALEARLRALEAAAARARPEELLRAADRAVLVLGARSQTEGHATVARNVGAPLDWYLHRGLLDAAEFDAGDRLRSDHATAFGSGIHGVDLGGVHGVSNYSDNWRISQPQADAMRRWRLALDQLDAEGAEFARRVCCGDVYAIDVARALGVRPRLGLDRLRHALRALARHYGRGRRPRAAA